MRTLERRLRSSAAIAFGMVCSTMGGATPAWAQYDRFANALGYSLADATAIYLPNATGTDGVKGIYIGTEDSGFDGLVVHASHNLEDLFRVDTARFNFREAKEQGKAPDFKDNNTKEYVCKHGTASYILWQNKLYIVYGAGPGDDLKDPARNSPSTNKCGGYQRSGGSTKFVDSSNFVLENDDPSDPFCERARAGAAKCWHTPTPNTSGNFSTTFPGRAVSFFKHNSNTTKPEIWAIWSTDNNVNLLKMEKPGVVDNGKDLADAVVVSSVAQTVLKRGYTNESQLTPDEKKNFRTYEYRHFLGDGTNEAPQGFSIPNNGDERTFITYSTNTWQGGSYLVSILKFTGTATDSLYNVALWQKANTPWFDTPAANYQDKSVNAALNFVNNPNAPFPDQADAPLVCGVGSNSFVWGPGYQELWMVYAGRASCTFKRSETPGPDNKTNHSVNDFVLIGQGNRSYRLHRVPINSVDANGFPALGDPYPEGALILRPKGEDRSQPSHQVLDPSLDAALAQTGVDASDNRIFAVGFDEDPNNPGMMRSDNRGSYFMIAYRGKNVTLLGPTLSTCTKGAAVSGSCGTIEITPDGDQTRMISKHLSDPAVVHDDVIFDTRDPEAQNMGLNTAQPEQHTLTVRLVQNEGDPVNSADPVNLRTVQVR